MKREHHYWLTMCLQLARILTSAIRLDSLPTACAVLVGGSTVFPVLFLKIGALVSRRLNCKASILTSKTSARLVRFAAALASAWVSFDLLNKKPISLHHANGSLSKDSPEGGNAPGRQHGAGGHQPTEYAGRTMDLTLFTLTRAVDVVVCIAWMYWSRWRKEKGRWSAIEAAAPKFADAGLFSVSSAVVMWAWFYLPERLPKSYERWISEAAKVDWRLIEALRRARRGVFVYGKETGQAPLLQSMCKDYNWPMVWGDPAKTIPMPCEMVHMGCGPSCEKHAAFRFAKSFKFACATYFPLQIAFRFRSLKSRAALIRAVSDALWSSTFLASFVSLFYYGVCLARARLGPKIFDKETVTPQMWDSGLCTGTGCLMCGWSILAENTRRRQEMALFVAPRAAATVFPRLYDRKVCLTNRVVSVRRLHPCYGLALLILHSYPRY